MEKKSEYTKMKGSKQLESGWMRRAAFWKMEVIIILMLTGFAFFINRHMKLECLYMDDLYQWYCYNDQSFWDAVFTMGGTRFRVLYNLVSWIEMALFGIHINWYVPFNIILNVGIAYTLYRMSRRFSHSIYVGVLCAVIFLSSRMSYYQIGQILGLMESMALWMALVILYLLYGYLNEEDGREEKRLYLAAVTADSAEKKLCPLSADGLSLCGVYRRLHCLLQRNNPCGNAVGICVLRRCPAVFILDVRCFD